MYITILLNILPCSLSHHTIITQEQTQLQDFERRLSLVSVGRRNSAPTNEPPDKEISHVAVSGSNDGETELINTHWNMQL